MLNIKDVNIFSVRECDLMCFTFRRIAIKRLPAVFLCFCICASGFTDKGIAAASKGIPFQDEITVDREVLSLHGIGLLKWKYLVNVYLVGLYKPGKVPVEHVLEDIPKRLEYYFFVDMKASDFQDTGFQLMARNVGEEKARRLTGELAALNKLYQDVKAGQRYTLTYRPGKGVEMALDDEVLGAVQGAEFAAAYFSIWLGPDPVSKSLQEGMFDPATKSQ
jgi:hypothetical protein